MYKTHSLTHTQKKKTKQCRSIFWWQADSSQAHVLLTTVLLVCLTMSRLFTASWMRSGTVTACCLSMNGAPSGRDNGPLLEKHLRLARKPQNLRAESHSWEVGDTQREAENRKCACWGPSYFVTAKYLLTPNQLLTDSPQHSYLWSNMLLNYPQRCRFVRHCAWKGQIENTFNVKYLVGGTNCLHTYIPILVDLNWLL